jgi:hypothetical protein
MTIAMGNELLIKGDDVKEHIRRFGAKGLGVADYAVIDFRTNMTGKVTNITRRPHLITVFSRKVTSLHANGPFLMEGMLRLHCNIKVIVALYLS